MLEEKIKKLNKAFEEYNLDERQELSSKILKYIKTRLEENKEELMVLSDLKQDVSIDRLIEIFDEESSKPEVYKKEKVLKKLENGFVYGSYTTSVGNVVIETGSTIDVLKYFIYGIQSRNTITISDLDYSEKDLKHALALIFSESIKKYGISEELLSIMPYEECYYDNFDVVINLDENKIEKKKEIEKLLIYKASNSFTNDGEKEILYLDKYKMDYEVITDDFENAVKKINIQKPIGAVIYTDDAELERKIREEVKVLSTRLASYKRPVNIVVKKAPLPKTTTRKIKRHEELKKMNLN